MRRGIATIGAIILLASTLLWAVLIDGAREARLNAVVQRQSAVRVATLWELEVITIAYRHMQRFDEILRAHSGGDLKGISDLIAGNIRIRPYSRIERGNLLIELKEVEFSLKPKTEGDTMLQLKRQPKFMRGEPRGTTFYVFVHVRVTDQLTGISKGSRGWIRITHPARLALVLNICERAVEQVSFPLTSNGVVGENPDFQEGFSVEVKTSTLGSHLTVSVKVVDSGVLGVFDGLNQDLVCVRSFSVS